MLIGGVNGLHFIIMLKGLKHSSFSLIFVTKWQVGKMASWQNGTLTKMVSWQIVSWLNYSR